MFPSKKAFSATPGVRVEVKLSPLGGFTAQFPNIQGKALLQKEEVLAENIKIQTSSVQTGIGLRDEHTRKYMESEKFPEVLLVKGVGKSGIAQTLVLKIKGIEKDVSKIKIEGVEMPNGTYKIEGDFLEADFQLHPSDFNIQGINYRGAGVKDLIGIHVTLPIQQNPVNPASPVSPASPATEVKKKKE